MVFAPLLLASCATSQNATDRAQIELLEAKAKLARERGAYRCAPSELAVAEANLEFTEFEFKEENEERAREHLQFGLSKIERALETTDPNECAPKRVVITRGEPVDTQPKKTTPQERARWVFAVMDMKNTGSAVGTEQSLKGLTDQLRVFLAQRRIKVIDRGTQEEAMKKLIAETKADSYKACVDSACQIPLGKSLAATHILRATLGRFGSQCTINAELVDLTTEVTPSGASQRSGCSEEHLLDAVEKLADQMAK